jgi:signal transduction histidine kinase
VFRRLYRLDKSRMTSGSGLGLSLVSAIADLHGGRVMLVDNNPGVRAETVLPLLP